MNIAKALLDSWDRQVRILDSVSSLITETNRHFKPSEDGWPLDQQLAHIHNVRHYFLKEVAPEQAVRLPETFVDGWKTPISDLSAIKSALTESAKVVREVVREGLTTGAPLKGPHVHYDNAVVFLQHMVWHEGWHVGLIFLALRLGGQEPPEEWEEPNVWGQWRKETW